MSRFLSEVNINQLSTIQGTLEVDDLTSISTLSSINNYSSTGSVISQNVFTGQNVIIEAWGAGGSNGLGPQGGEGGNGGYSKSTYQINENGILQIVVGSINTGGAGGSGGGQNGGAGGGSSYVYFGNTGSFDLLAVAGGGGGGGGGGSTINTKGDGGDSNSNGTTAVYLTFLLGRGGGGGDNNTGGAGGAGNNSQPNGVNGSSGMSTNISNVTLNLDASGGAGGSGSQAGGGGGGKGYGGGGGGGSDGGAGSNFSGGGGGGGGGNFGDITLQDGTLSSTVGTPVPTNVATAGNNGYVIITVFNNNINSETNLIPTGSLTLGSISSQFRDIYANNSVLMNGANTLTLSNSSNQLSIASSTGSFLVQFPSKGYIQTTFNSNHSLNAGDIIFDSISATGSISYNTSTGEFSLLSGKTYLISTTLQGLLANSNSDFTFAVCKSDNTQLSKEFYAVAYNSTSTQVKVGANEFIYTPSSNENIKIRTITNNSALPFSIFSTQYSGCFIKEL